MKIHLLILLSLTTTALCKPYNNDSQTDDNSNHPDDNLIPTHIQSDPEESNTTETTTAKKSDDIILPEPINISTNIGVISKDSDPSEVGHKVEIDLDGIPVIHGVRVPDDPNDKKIWRNGRVLNNVLIENNPSNGVADLGDMFIYRPASSRAINNDGGFKPSQADDTFTPSLPFPAFYYQSYYKDKDGVAQLPDTVGVESTETPLNDTESRGNVYFQENYKIQPSEVSNSVNKIHKTVVAGRPVYFVSEDVAKSIHDDRSPFDFEPAQVGESSSSADETDDNPAGQKPGDFYYYRNPSSQQQPIAVNRKQEIYPQRAGYYQDNYQQSYSYPSIPGNVIPAPADSFVIREQTYNSGGTTFKIPIPIPKEQFGQQQPIQPHYQYQYNPGYQTIRYPLPNDETIGSKIKGQVQKGMDKLHDITAPVIDPIVEAGQKISSNLGIPERVQTISKKVAQTEVAVPLALIGGAALAVGTIAGSVALSRNNVTRRLIKIKRSTDRLDDLEDEDQANILDHIMTGLNGPQKTFLTELQKTGFDNWKDAPCAKRIFCDVMVQQNDEAVALMEKRMSTFLSLLDSGIAESLHILISDVMDGIRKRDCNPFQCGDQLRESGEDDSRP